MTKNGLLAFFALETRHNTNTHTAWNVQSNHHTTHRRARGESSWSSVALASGFSDRYCGAQAHGEEAVDGSG